MAEILYVNGVDVSTLGVGVTSVGAAWSSPTVERASASPFATFGAIAATESTHAPLVLELGLLLDADRVDRVTDLDAVHRLFTGLLEIRFGDTDRVVYGLLEQGAVVGESGGAADWVHTRGPLALSWTIVCHDPLRYDQDVTGVGFSSSAAALPLGTAPSAGLVTIYGAATNPTLTYRDQVGDALLPVSGDSVTMGFTATLGADDALEVDLAAKKVTRIDAGVRSDALSTLTSGWFFALDPADGNAAASSWPTLEVSSGTALATYRRAWL